MNARVAESAARKSELRAWNACANPRGHCPMPHPFTTHEFFSALEESGSASARTGWRPAHIAVERDGKTLGIMPAYLKDHSQGEYVFDHAWAERAGRAGRRLLSQAAILGALHAYATGHRLLVAADAELATKRRSALLAAGTAAAREFHASSLHITFLTRAEWDAAGAAGFLQRTDTQFHWENRGYANFDEFLGELSSARRKYAEEGTRINPRRPESNSTCSRAPTSRNPTGTRSSRSTWIPAGANGDIPT